MRLLTLVSVAGLITACGGGDRAQTSPEESTELATRSAQTVREISDASGAKRDERPRNADTQDAVEPPEGTTAPDATTEVEPCELSDGMCPNACEHGESGPGEVCVTDSDCDCGHCCGFGTCQPFDVMGCESFSEYAGCLCHGETPSRDPVEPDEEGEALWRVDAMDYVDDCDAPTPTGSLCNPFCQLGCPPGSHCAMVNDISFGCVESGAGTLGDPCNNPGECGPWWSCFGTFDAASDTCRQVCDADEECPSGQACNLNIQLTSALTIRFCDTAVMPCDLWLPDCPESMKCVALGGESICTESTWDGIEGYPCEAPGDCAVQSENGDRMLCLSTVGCAPVCSTADSLPLGAKACTEMCPGGYTSVDIKLNIGRCSDAGP